MTGKKMLIVAAFVSAVMAASAQNTANRPETLQTLASAFASPPDRYKVCAWWQWLGTFFSKDGITKDLESMKEAGVIGVIVCNTGSWLDPSRTPWPENKFRSPAYWDALGHALSEARRLGMHVYLVNSPGWATDGGTWITPEEGMQSAVIASIELEGDSDIDIRLPNLGYDSEAKRYYKDVAVVAVADKGNASPDTMIDISDHLHEGKLSWKSPPGAWTVYRFGYCPKMQHTHPAPEDVAAASLEVDKMNVAANRKHWTNVIEPLKEKFGEYIGNTLCSIWIDSYEAFGQTWSPTFRDDFIAMKGYDPVREIIRAYSVGDTIFNRHDLAGNREAFAERTRVFMRDYEDVIGRLMLKCFNVGKEMIHDAGFEFSWEPYGSIIDAPFSSASGVAISDLPVTEFWVHTRHIGGESDLTEAAARYGKRIVGAEAFTGMEATCKYNETPAMLKGPADMAFCNGVNRMFLHAWAHNPLDDKYQPGWNFAHYGTHFGRNQTWIRPVRAFFEYLARCQMLLQQGTYVDRNDSVIHRTIPEAEIFFVRNMRREPVKKVYEFPAVSAYPELWNAYSGKIFEASEVKVMNQKTFVELSLNPDESVFVIFPRGQTAYAKERAVVASPTVERELKGAWAVTFVPKTGEKPFTRRFATLTDWSASKDRAVRYFSGTAAYDTELTLSQAELQAAGSFVLDLGEVCDIAEVEVNGRAVATLWMKPFAIDIAPFLRAGTNRLRVSVTNTWVNRLIGDEQYPADFEWTDRNQGLRAMKALPDWVLHDLPRPVKERKAFVPWYYYGKDAKLLKGGLLGPVKLLSPVSLQDIK